MANDLKRGRPGLVVLEIGGELLYLPYQIRRLAREVDSSRLLSDFANVEQDWWIPHRFDDTGHEVLLLITTNGTLKHADGSDNHLLLPPFKPTVYLQSLPYCREILNSFGVAPARARLMKLRANEFVKPHRDLHPHWNDKVRVHFPIVTNPGVLWKIWRDDESCPPAHKTTVHMAAGEAWIFNTFYYHAVVNPSLHDRIHLVCDFEVQGKLSDLVFAGCSAADIAAATNFSYPQYAPDSDVRRWANGASGSN